MTWMKSRLFQRLGGGRMERVAIAIVSRIQAMQLGGHKDPEILRLMRSVRRERKSLLLANEQFFLYACARAQSRRPGDFAEVGVFEGASARLICEVKGNKPLHLFDTFEGLPASHPRDRGVHRTHQYTCDMESVREYLEQYEDVHLYKGRFPESAQGMEERSYSFVHFDVDIYQSTLGCLEYFYPRMTPGGIMLSHDYSLLAGVESAFAEFLADKPEELIEIPTTQCMVVKLPA